MYTCQVRSHPLRVYEGTGKALPMSILLTGKGMGCSGPTARVVIENTMLNECSGLGSPHEILYASLKKQDWKATLTTLCAATSSDLCFLSYTKDWPAVQLEMLPRLLDLETAFFTLNNCDLLTSLVTLRSLSMTICPSIILSENVLIAACLIKWMNPHVN